DGDVRSKHVLVERVVGDLEHTRRVAALLKGQTQRVRPFRAARRGGGQAPSRPPRPRSCGSASSRLPRGRRSASEPPTREPPPSPRGTSSRSETRSPCND